MHDHAPRHSIDLVLLLPGEVVVVFNIEDHFRTEIPHDLAVDHSMIGGGIAAHQVHRLPVFLPGRGIERQPGKLPQFAGQTGAEGHRQAGIVVADRGAGAARTGMGEQGEEDPSSSQPKRPGLHRIHAERAKFHKVIAAAAGAQLQPGLVAIAERDGGNGPILVEHRMLAGGSALRIAAAAKFRADAKPGFHFQRPGQPIALRLEPAGRQVEHRELHPAGDIDSHGVGHDGVRSCQHPADRQAVADMGVGHQRTRHRHRQLHRLPHLPQRLFIDIAPPLPPGGRDWAR